MEKKYKNQISSGKIKCTCCGELKPLENYYFNKGSYIYKCKSCIKKKYHEVKGKNKIKDISSGYVNCRTCGELNPLENYYRLKNGYYNYECKVCGRERDKRYLKRKSIKKSLSPERQLFAQGLKTCNTCGEVKEFKEFRIKNPKHFTPSSKCLLCSKPIIKEKQKRYYEKISNREDFKERRRNSKIKYNEKKSEERRIIREENKRIKLEERNKQKEIKRLERERILEEARLIRQQKQDEIRKRKEYYRSEEYKQKRKEKHYERWKRRWNEDELFAMTVRLRNLIRNSFRKQGYKKFNSSTESIVGINYNEFKEYLESKFLEGMTWENRGDWHIDHIIPLSSSTSRDDLIRLCHYTNLQPLWAIDNMKKGNKIL